MKILSALAILFHCFLGQAQAIDHSLWDDLLQEHVTSEGQVDYTGFRQDYAILAQYVDHLERLLPQVQKSDKNEQLAFWINAYNACTVRLICDHMPISSIKDISRPWKKVVMTAADRSYTLDDIEHNILRKMNEPRMHFAINCASMSCPQLANQAYLGRKIDRQLETAAQGFLRDTSKNIIAPSQIFLSKIFLWFRTDFGTTTDLIQMINQHTGSSVPDNVSITYLSYDWALNN